MRRVLVIGICGAGKSTFSQVLAARTGLPLIHLDKEFWRPGWADRPPEGFIRHPAGPSGAVVFERKDAP